MKNEVNADVLGDIVKSALSGEVKKVTAFISDKFVVKAKRKMFNGKIDKRSRIAEVVVTAGAPNYAERVKIKKMLNNDEKFPLFTWINI
jgi:hypothetical protein